VLLSVKEVINNAVRHGRPTQITLSLAIADSSFEVSIHDNGVGFDVSKHSRGNGLVNLRQRMEECGGRCEIESTAPNGTTVRLNVPLPKD
jgi:signal transduction histidine kinase